MKVRRDVLLSALMVVTAACGASSAQGFTSDGNAGTVPGVGVLPLGSDPIDAVIATTAPIPTTTLAPGQRIGARVTGNRVIVIGDSITASTASRHGRNMCDALVPLGWQVEVDAETSRFVDFGSTVLDERLAAGWDAAVVFLGTNFSAGTIEGYWKQLDRIVRRLGPRQVVLLTASEVSLDRFQVNQVIRSMADSYDYVTILEWGAISVAETGLLLEDGIHLTDSGRDVFAQSVADVLGKAPLQPGKCLPTIFVDDSAGSVTGSTTTVPRRRTTPTTKPVTTTTKPTTTTTGPATSTTTTTTTTDP